MRLGFGSVALMNWLLAVSASSVCLILGFGFLVGCERLVQEEIHD